MEMKEEVRKRLFELTQVECNILIIEDHILLVTDLTRELQKMFPSAKVRALTADEFMHIETFFDDRTYDVVTVDGRLGLWAPHPKYKNYGDMIVPLILEKNPGVIVISTSSDPTNNKYAMEQGAHHGIEKSNIASLLK